MSVMMSNDKTLVEVAQAVCRGIGFVPNCPAVDTPVAAFNEVLVILWKANMESYNAVTRGDKEEGAPPTVTEVPDETLNVVETLKLIQFVSYQASDAPGYATRKARECLELATSATIARLPGYDAAQWGLR